VSGSIDVRVLLEEHAVAAPEYKSDLASGLDLAAAIQGEVTIEPGAVVPIPTGIRLEIPAGYEGQVRARSGLAARHAIGVPNAPGTIDADYRGEIQVLLVNFGSRPYVVRRGDRIAQLVFAPVARARLHASSVLGATARGDGGFGHTGR
jgi:dUTP pyrophosphatase